MLTRLNCLPGLIAFWAIALLGTSAALGQDSVVEFKKILREEAAFDETDFAALEQGQTVVRLLPVKDKREVAVSGLVSLQVPAEVFLQSFRENMFRKSNPAILEIGSFSAAPTLDDLQTLTIEDRDLEDLKECVVGDCKLKLSAMMIARGKTSSGKTALGIEGARMIPSALTSSTANNASALPDLSTMAPPRRCGS